MISIASRILAIAVTISIAGLAGPAPMASAASGEIQLSIDGHTFATQFPGTLFDSIGHVVPGDTQESKFFLRNSGDAPGFLRVTLRDVSSTNTDFLHALTISASTVTRQGTPVVLGEVNPCWVLVEGQTIGAGETIAVTTKLALGNLDGLAGQGATASAVLRVSLDDTSAGALPPTDCGGAGTDIPVLPSPGPRANPGQGTAFLSPPDTGFPGSSESESEAGDDLPVLNLPGGFVIDPNTWHLYEEFLVLILFASAVLGGGWFMIVARRRRNREDEEMDVTA